MKHDMQLIRSRMVQTQLKGRDITDPAVLAAMEDIPRHLFVDESLRLQAYSDNALPIGHRQTISQPYMVALMTQALDLQGTEKILEIGSGSGYQTAVLARLCDWIYSIERLSALFYQAQQVLEDLRIFNINLKLGDGSRGWPEHAPYDAILVAAGAPQVPGPLLEQLAPGGRLVIPVGGSATQNLLRITRHEDGFTRQELVGCRFVRLVGEHAWR